MVTFRFALAGLPMRIAEEPFTAGGVEFPAGSFLASGSTDQLSRARALADSIGLTGVALSAMPNVRAHDGDVPRIAMSSWPHRTSNRAAVLAEPADRPQPYQRTEKLRFLGMYGETADMTGGFGEDGVAAIERFLTAGGTLIATANAVRFPIEFGFAHTIDLEPPEGVNVQKLLIQAKITRTDHPVFYGWADSIFPMKYGQGSQVFRVGVADSTNVLARYVGGDDAVLSGLMTGAENIAGRAFAVDVPYAYRGNGRVIMFANNPVYRWQNHGEFNMLFNSILNWNDVPARVPLAEPV